MSTTVIEGFVIGYARGPRGFLAALPAGRVQQDDGVRQVRAGPGAVPEIGEIQLVQHGAAQPGSPGRRQRAVLLQQACREDQANRQPGCERRLSGQRVHAGLAASDHRQAGCGVQLAAQRPPGTGSGRRAQQ